MEVKPGYKRTVVGVIPEEWEVLPLRECAGFRTGPFGSALHKTDYTNDGIPVINPMHIVDGRIEPTREMTVTEMAAENLSDFRVGPGAIVIGRRGDMGRCAVIQPHQAGWLCGTGSMIVRCNKRVDAYFLQRVLSSPQAVAAIEDTSVGTTMINLNQSTLAELRIQLPPLSEQRAIAEVLSDVDALLAGLEKLIAKKRDLKQAAMQKLLTGKLRLSGFSGAWANAALGEKIDMLTGFPFPSSHYSETGVRLLRGSNVKRGQTDWADDLIQYWPRITPELIKYSLEPGDLVIAMDGSLVGRSFARLTPEDLPALLLQRVARLRSNKLDMGFLAQVIGSNLFVDYCDAVKTVTAIPHISASDIRDFVVAVPPSISEQSAIAAVLSDMDAELTALEQRLAKTRAIKQGMIQELLTGRIRLVSASSNIVPFPATPAAAPVPAPAESKPHNWAINEAVVISVLAKHFGSEKFPLGRKRYTKLSYLLHRHVEKEAEGYLKKAAGPYNPSTKYKGPEAIAQKNGYIRQHTSGQFSGFIPGDNIAKAEHYFLQWYGPDVLKWLEQFRFAKNDELELLATVDMAMEDLRKSGTEPTFAGVKNLINNEPEWHPKLSRPVFADAQITAAMADCRSLFA